MPPHTAELGGGTLPSRLLNFAERRLHAESLKPSSQKIARARLDWWAESNFGGGKRLRNRWLRDACGVRLYEALQLTEVDSDVVWHEEEIPDWLRCHSEALSDANFARLKEEIPKRNGKTPLGLDALAYPFILWAMPQFEQIVNDIRRAGIPVSDRALQPAINYLGGRLRMMSERAAVLAMNVARIGETLEGQNAEERAEDFAYQLIDREKRRQLMATVPVLDRRLAHFTAGLVAAIAETARRLVENWSEISEKFSIEGALLALEPGLGDPHKNIRTVSVLRFESGSVIYKPRSMRVDQAFANLVSWVNQRSGLSLPATETLHCGDHGWTTFIGNSDCETMEEVRDGHRRMGGLLALLHLCGASDVHYENIIFNRSSPYVVDLETALSPFPRAFGDRDVDYR